MRFEVLTAVGVAEDVGLVEHRPCRLVTGYRRRQGYLILTGLFDPGNEAPLCVRKSVTVCQPTRRNISEELQLNQREQAHIQ